jgi:XRE family transcriptional regulator, regulator of sulfur utilization
MEIGKALARAREKRGMTQRELASLSQLSSTYLSQIENGWKEPAIATLKLIAKALKVPLPVLFFMSMTEEDVPTEKKEAYKMLAPSLANIVDHLFLEPQ